MNMTAHSWTYLPLSSALLATIYVSFVHQCSGTCLFKETGASIRNVEREIVQEDTLIFKHDWNNTMYCYNVYFVHFNNRFLIMAMMQVYE